MCDVDEDEKEGNWNGGKTSRARAIAPAGVEKGRSYRCLLPIARYSGVKSERRSSVSLLNSPDVGESIVQREIRKLCATLGQLGGARNAREPR